MATQSGASLSRDVMAGVLARVDGPTLAAAASASCGLNAIAQEDNLWHLLCNSTWPSTRDERINHVIASHGGFARFYANSFPLLVYRPKLQDPSAFQLPGGGGSKPDSDSLCSSSSHLVTLVDLYYNKKPIFSKVYGFAGVDADLSGGCFLDCPFRLNILQYHDKNTPSYNSDDDDDDDGDDKGMYPSVLLEEEMKGAIEGERMCSELEQKVRLSWVVLDTVTGRAVRLSSWKPLLVQRYWPTGGHISMRFGCVVPPAVKHEEAVECVTYVKCKVLKRQGRIQWREMRMHVVDKEGRFVNGKTSLMVLDRALRLTGSRSCKRGEFEGGYEEYEREKRKMTPSSSNERLFMFALLLLACSISLFTYIQHYSPSIL